MSPPELPPLGGTALAVVPEDLESPQERRLIACCAAAHQAQRLDHHAEAAAAFGEALLLLGPGRDDDNDTLVLLRGELLAGEAAAHWELGRDTGTEQRLDAALNAVLRVRGTTATERACCAAAWLRYELGRLAARRRDLAGALNLFDAAVRDLEGHPAPTLRARIEGRHGTALALAGDPASAVQRLDSALAMMSLPPLVGHVRERAVLAMNRALALSELGRHEQARAGLAEAVAQMEGLVPTQPAEAHAELARLRRNLGTVLSRAGRVDEAIEQFRGAIGDFEQLLGGRGKPSDMLTWRASLAATQMNLGYSLFVRGDFDESARWLHRAAVAQARWIKVRPGLREEQARTWINQAHLAVRVDDLDRATTLYRRAARSLAMLMTHGSTHCEIDRLNAELGLARVQLRRGRIGPAAALFESAAMALAELTRQGQVQHAQAWLAAWQAQAAAWLALADRRPDGAAPVVDALVRVAAAPPRRPSMTGQDPVTSLRAAVDTLQAWRAAQPKTSAGARQFRRLTAAYLQLLFDAVATLLSDADPYWIREQAGGVSQLISRLRDAAAADEDASAQLVEWFFATHGLRAQRVALAQGSEAEVIELRELLHEQQVLEQELLGECGVTTPSPAQSAGASAGPSAPLFAPGATTSAYHQRRMQTWQTRRRHIERIRQRLVDDGVLPPSQRLRAGIAAAALKAGRALLVLHRVDRQQVLAIQLRSSDGTGWTAVHRMTELDEASGAFSGAELNRLARASMTASARGQAMRRHLDETAAETSGDVTRDADADLFALEMFERLWDQAVAPVIAELAAEGIEEVSVVPSGDLHLLPWTHLTCRAAGLQTRIRVYPSAGAWVRWAGRNATAIAPRWALAAGAAANSSHPLPWVDVERRLSQRLWGHSLLAVGFDKDGRPWAEGVTALLGMGHGGAPAGNPALAGLALDGAVFGAHDWPRIRTCRQALLSACVLGQTEEAFGEPLGFLSSCFDYRAGVAAGWLTEVADLTACLISLAAQWALHEAAVAPSQAMATLLAASIPAAGEPGGVGLSGRAPEAALSWVDVLHGVHRTISAGRWPAGFAQWLEADWPATPALDRSILAAPSAAVKRAMPWFVVLGR